jgi:hypothetical protein
MDHELVSKVHPRFHQLKRIGQNQNYRFFSNKTLERLQPKVILNSKTNHYLLQLFFGTYIQMNISTT